MLDLRAVRPPQPSLLSRPGRCLRGFTAVELMVTVAILAVLAALAAPSFNALAERWRVRQAAEELQSTLYFARSEAIKRGGDVVLRAEGSAWNNGWKVWHAGDNTPLQETAAPTNVDIVHSSGQTSLYADRWGMLSEGAQRTPSLVTMSFLLGPKDKTATDSNAIRLCVGRGARVAQKKYSETCGP